MSDTCGCCGWDEWWRNPGCVQAQPPEFVIDDARPWVLRAPRPDDFVQGSLAWQVADDLVPPPAGPVRESGAEQ